MQEQAASLVVGQLPEVRAAVVQVQEQIAVHRW